MNLRSPGIAECAWAVAALMATVMPLRWSRPTPPLERVQTIALKGPVGGLDHLAVDSKRGRLFVANTVNDSLDIVDLKAGKLLKQVPGQGRIRGIDYSPEADRVFVGNGTGGVCNTFDGENYELLKSVPLGVDADNVRYNPRTTDLRRPRGYGAVGHRRQGLHAPQPDRAAEVAGSVSTGIGTATDVRQRQDAGVAIDTEQDKMIGRFPVAPAGVNAAVAIDEPNHRLFVGCRQNPSLVVMDSDTGKIVASVPIPGDVDDLSFDATAEADLRLVRRWGDRGDPPGRRRSV